MMYNSFAIIVAVENYQFADQRGLSKVKFAKKDAQDFRNMLKSEFGLVDDEIMMLTDASVTKSLLENELPYKIRQLQECERFFFYYAGHGFSFNNVNRITTWDTHPFNLMDTTVSILDILINPLKESKCKQSLMFIDACAVNLGTNSRDLISDMNTSEFESFIKDTPFRAVFCSCSPGEKSYSDATLGNGIWTWHLIQALKGAVPEAIVRDKFITDDSLKNCLRAKVPKYITTKTNIRGIQTPFAMIDASNTFQIRQLPPTLTNKSVMPELKLDTKNTALRKMEFIPVKKMLGFKKCHTVPECETQATRNFVKSLYDNEIKSEIDTIYENTKEYLNLRRKQIAKATSVGGGNIDTNAFRYSITVAQSSEEPSEATVLRRLEIRADVSSLPSGFDSIFPVSMDEIVIPIKGNIDFDDMVETFENLKDEIGGSLHEDDEAGLIKFTTSSGFMVIVEEYKQNLIIKPNSASCCGSLELLKAAELGMASLLGNPSIKLLR